MGKIRTASAKSAVDAGPHPAYPINSFSTGLQLLELFRGPGIPVRVTEASVALGVSTSTAHRLLGVLRQREFIRQDPKTRAYYAGATLLELAQNLIEETALCRASVQELDRLMRRTGEMTLLCVLRGSEAHFIASVPGPSYAGLPPRLGSPAYATAGGKVLLAELSAAERRRTFSKATLTAKTDTTITRRRVLERELVAVRERGYATSTGENRSGYNAISVPLRGSGGKVYGSIGVLGFASRLPERRVGTIVGELRRSSDAIVARFEAAFALLR
jgi:IclR family acetate operon transcriptional repressor